MKNLFQSIRTPNQGPFITIVSGLPRTDSAVAQTDTIVNGIRMALEEANYQAGGFAIEYADWDDATSLHSCGPSLIPQWY